MEEPLYRPPAPSPHPLADPLDSSGLDLTPEKRKRSSRKLRLARNENYPPTGREPLNKSRQPLIQPEPGVSAVTTSSPELTAPALNSTARLQHQIQGLRQQRQRSGNHECHCPLRPSSSPSDSTSIAGSVMADKPLKEVNVPRHVSRYSDLVPVDVSEESFQKLTARPRRKEPPTSRQSGVRPDEPNIMEFFTPDREWEEAEWNGDGTPSRVEPEPVDVPGGAPFSLYQLMQTLQS